MEELDNYSRELEQPKINSQITAYETISKKSSEKSIESQFSLTSSPLKSRKKRVARNEDIAGYLN